VLLVLFNANMSDDIFKARAESLFKLYTKEGGNLGFLIPEYQRGYDWNKKNIQRLFEDILTGLKQREKDPKSVSFLGTLILLDNEEKENSFDGYSYSIIDGQQRLTTISLIASRLFGFLDQMLNSLEKLSLKEKSKNWLVVEIKHIKLRLLRLTFGTLENEHLETFPFPRIIRHYDNRASSERDSQYESVISKYLFDFSLYVRSKEYDQQFIFKFDESNENKLLEDNINIIDEVISKIIVHDIHQVLDVSLPQKTEITRVGYSSLFEKLSNNAVDKNKVLSDVQNTNGELIEIIRLVLFSNFLLSKVIVTVVTVVEEKYGFDIFDSLNTTGEPLTAIQTFKPRVIRFEKDDGKGYSGSISEKYFTLVEEYLEAFEILSNKQRASQDLIVSFALYKTGEKVSLKLDAQRHYLKTKLDSISNQINIKEQLKSKRELVKNLSDVACFYSSFWNKDNIVSVLPNFENRNLLLLCINFLMDLKMTMCIPVICRFLECSNILNDKTYFEKSLLAFTAYIVLRRGATGRTDGIDSDIRSMMQFGLMKKEPTPLSVGMKNENEVLSIDKVKEILRGYLLKKKVVDKESWVGLVVNKPLYKEAKDLCKFILITAFHHSRTSINSILLKKEKPSNETDYLNIDSWRSNHFRTVEHIAPQAKTKNWDQEIYTQPYLVHSIGNLTLLPQVENNVAGYNSWKFKKLLFDAFSCATIEDVQQIIEKAKKQGVTFSEKTKDILLHKPKQLPYLKSIINSEKWTKEIIESRGKNIGNLAWDEISKWLF